MRKLLSIAMIFSFSILSFTACSVEQPDEYENVIVTEYPKAIDEYVLANYSPLMILEVSIHEEEEYEVALDDRPTTVLIFDLDGNFLEED